MSATCDPPLPREGEAASRFAVASLLPRVDFRARCAAASPPARRSQELSGGGCNPVPEPMPASPRLIAGLSNSASAGPIGCTSGRWAFEFGALDFGVFPLGFFGSDFFAMGRIWDESGAHERAKQTAPTCARRDAVSTVSAGSEGVPQLVMAGLVPAIHVLVAGNKVVDAR